MAEVIKEVPQDSVVLDNPTGSASNPVMATQVKTAATNTQTTEYLIYFIFGLIEILLAFRLVFKLAGANPVSGFVNFIYALTDLFVSPFTGIFSRATTTGVETTAVFEPETLVALVVYALLSWGIVKLVHIVSGEKQVS